MTERAAIKLDRSSHIRTAIDLQRAIAIAQRAVLRVDGRESASPVREVVELFMKSPDLRELEGWSAAALTSGVIVVTFSFWNGTQPERAEWSVILDSQEVRYRNLYAKYMSWAPAD